MARPANVSSESLCDSLLQWRVAKQITQREAAEILGIGESTYIAAETHGKASKFTLAKIKNALGSYFQE